MAHRMRFFFTAGVALCGAMLLLAGMAFAAQAPAAQPIPVAAAQPPRPPLFAGLAQSPLPEPVTVITVTTTADANVSLSETCSSVIGSDDERCTLRRAIVEARGLPTAERPVLISFNLPVTESNNLAAPEWWVMQITPDNPQSPLGSTTGANFDGGQIIIDGTTQPGGRDPAAGPKVFIPNEGSRFERFVVSGDDNVIRGIGWLGLRLIFNNSNNLIDLNWFGLNPDGQSIYLFEGDPIRDNNATVEFSEASQNNTIRNNVFAGARTNAITLRASNSTVRNNYIGTRGDGTVPDVASNRYCRPNASFFNWFGGGGIVVSGASNTVQENNIVGLLYASGDVLTTPDNAITVEDGSNTIISNTIGIDAAGTRFGTCGRGIILTDRSNQITANTIYGARLEGAIGIRGSDASLGANTIRGNIISDTVQSVFIFPRVTDAYEYFNPAKITAITGTTVVGTNGDPGQPPTGNPVDSTCLGCIIEIFLEDSDALTESLQSLGTVTSSTEDGSWTFELPAPLEPGQFLRTTSTSVQQGQIATYDAGATTKTSAEAYGVDGVLDPDPLPPPPPLPSPPAFDGLLPVLRDPPPLSFPAAYSKTITVTTSADFNVSRSETCESEANEPTDAACTLRRAINEGNTTDGPVLIRFNLPITDTGYNSDLNVWVIEMSNQVGSDELEINGQIVLDGTTQPNGRPLSAGPSVFVRGANNFENIVIRGDSSIIRGLGWQRVELVPSGGNGIFIEDNWLGLTENGQEIFIIGNETTDNKSTVELFSNNNVVRGNVLAGARDRAIVVRGSDNFVVGNFLGTRGDGSVPPIDVLCQQGAGEWFGGSGILVEGNNNQIGGPGEQANIIGSTFVASTGGAVQPPSIETQGSFNMIYGNIIGRDANGENRGVCGEGVRADKSFNIFQDNTIYGAQQGILTAGVPNQYIGNRIIASVGATGFTQELEMLNNYAPAKVTAIEGTSVSGTSGDIFVDPATGQTFDPTCPFCIVQLFADDQDESREALALLATTTSDGNGNWTATLTRPLSPTEGLRSMTITGDYASIRAILSEVGFSTKLSEDLYIAGQLSTPTPTPTATSVITATATPTATTIVTGTATPTPTATGVVTGTATPTPTATGVVTGTATPTATPTATGPEATPTPTSTPVTTETQISPETGGELPVSDGSLNATISVPAGAVTETITLRYSGLPNTNEPLGEGLTMRNRFQITAITQSGGSLARFQQPVSISINLASVRGIQLAQDASDPVAFARDASNSWVRTETLCDAGSTCSQSVSNGVLSLTVDYSGEFALGQQATTQRVYLPLIVRQVSGQ